MGVPAPAVHRGAMVAEHAEYRFVVNLHAELAENVAGFGDNPFDEFIREQTQSRSHESPFQTV
jgi:hypothetical protein